MVKKPTFDELYTAILALGSRNTNNIKQKKEKDVLDLIDAGAPVEQLPMEGVMQPIHIAAFKGSAIIVKKLIEAGADINALTSSDTTAVYDSLAQGHLNVLKVLREHGATMKGLQVFNWGVKDDIPVLANILLEHLERFPTTIAYYVKYIDMSEIQETIDILEDYYNTLPNPRSSEHYYNTYTGHVYHEDMDKARKALRGAKAIYFREQTRRRKNNTLKQLKNIYEMAPPMPGMSMGGPLYQEGKERWNKNMASAQSRKTRKKRQ